jgi:hypothetical protein
MAIIGIDALQTCVEELYGFSNKTIWFPRQREFWIGCSDSDSSNLTSPVIL